MIPPIILVLSRPGMVAFFQKELSSLGYIVFGKTTAQEALRYLVVQPHIVLVFDHFIDDNPDIVQLCCTIQTQLRAPASLLVITDDITRNEIASVTTKTYSYIGGISSVIEYIKATTPIT